MCGRYNLRATPEQLIEIFEVLRAPAPAEDWLAPRYNIAPTQTVAAIRAGSDGCRELIPLRWGLIPSWSKERATGAPLINARAESVATKPAFRSAFRTRRCLIPATGFYEWKQVGRAKQPFHIRLPDNRPFAFAGLWERWAPKGGEPVESCTILTTEANELLGTLHDRMPVILPQHAWHAWLDLELQDPQALEQLLVPFQDAPLRMDAVSSKVNNVRNESPDCIASITSRDLFDP